MVVLATRNPHKVLEMRRLLEPAGIGVVPLPDGVELPPEDGLTFADNALIKAQTAAADTGRPSIADDSGIEATALGGAPGVRSARFAGPSATDEQNLEKLVLEAPADSRLRYVCALAYVNPETGEERVFFGDCRGRVARVRAGSNGSVTTRYSFPTPPGTTERWLSSPTPRRTRSAIAATRCARSPMVPEPEPPPAPTLEPSSKRAHGCVVGRIERGADPAQGGRGLDRPGSVAMLTEAVHSSIDLIASIVAFFSVRKAGEPADESHRYGHEKLENLAGGDRRDR